MPSAHLTQHQQGFTLLEMTLAIILLSILSTVGLNMISDSYTTTRIINNGNANTSAARYALDRVSREMRQVTFNSSTKALMITAAAPTQMSFTKSNFLAQEAITLHLNGTSLLLSNATVGVDSVLAEHVTAFTLEYFDATMVTPPASLGVIRFVQVGLRLAEANAEPVELHMLVSLRNR